GIVDVADSVHGAEGGQVEAVLLEEFADLDDVLVEGPALDVGMHAPHRVDQRLAGDHLALVRVQVGQDAEFLATELYRSASGEGDLQALRRDLGAAEI